MSTAQAQAMVQGAGCMLEQQSAPVRAPGRNATMTLTSWSAMRDVDEHTWVVQGRRLGHVSRASAWWIGDWLRYGNQRWGERYARAARITGYDVQTLTNMVYVASSFEPSERRSQLTWSHHAELAALAGEERQRYLDLAEAERLSVRDLREEVRRRLGKPRGESSAKSALTCPQCGYSVGKGSV